MAKYKIHAEYEIPQLRFASMDCPNCGNKINLMCDAKNNYGSNIHDSVDLHFMIVDCTKCGEHIDTRGEELEIDER